MFSSTHMESDAGLGMQVSGKQLIKTAGP